MSHRLSLLEPQGSDVQARRPQAHVSLSRVGVTGVEKVISLRAEEAEQLFYAELECFVDLNPLQKGAHMSRFEETVNEAIDEAVQQGAFKAEALAARIAERVRERQGGLRAEVVIAARYPQVKTTPVSGARTQEIHSLFGAAVAAQEGTRRLVGVQAQGMTACPCAQEMLIERSRERLAADGFTEEEIGRILERVPVATHNQRGLGTLYIGSPQGAAGDVDAQVLLSIVQSSMSAEVYELLKRPDEAEVVEAAHRRPRFVEDCVREAVRMSVEAFPHLGDSAFVMSRQENIETIHKHNVVAERYGLMGELARELAADEPAGRHVTMREWLEGA
jgi:GTP cyclohydrolase I/GTP cyclohydrolase-4